MPTSLPPPLPRFYPNNSILRQLMNAKAIRPESADQTILLPDAPARVQTRPADG